MKELIVVVSKYQVLLTLQPLQYAIGCLQIMAGNVTQYEYMVVVLDDSIPVLHQPVVIILRPIQLVVRECQVVLCSPYWIRIRLISKMNV